MLCPAVENVLRFFKINETKGFANQRWFAGGKISNKKVFSRAVKQELFHTHRNLIAGLFGVG